ncbi:unnamed protein product [Heterobilharzia americana]|nr:unnamed protein product [Heterobilharzia americana]
MQWYPVGEDTRSLFLNLTTPRYFHNVEIFLEDISNHSETEWLHLLSLQQIIRLQYLQANESVGLASYIHSGKKYITFKQTIHYSNKTEEKWKSCWQAVKHDLYEESICHSSKNHSITLIKGFKIYFSYIPPRKQQHLGNVLYNATKIISNGHKLREQAHVKLKYFQNTITHVSSKKPKSLQCDHNLDKWSSGPFRSYNLQANDKQYIKYRSIDLVPIKNLWKTGIANCQSTAPIGPQICNCPVL